MARRKIQVPGDHLVQALKQPMPVETTWDTTGLHYEEPKLAIPEDWQLGALLNVRNMGEYFVTLFPEEYDHRHPERALRFQNPATCQNFVSAWYARQHFDGRA